MCRTLSDVWLCFLHRCGPWLVFNVPWLELNDGDEAGHWASGLFGELCKQRCSSSSLIRQLVSCFLLLKRPGKHPGESSQNPQLSGNGSMFFLLLAPSLFNYCLLWCFIFLFYVSSSWLWPLVLFLSHYAKHSSTSASGFLNASHSIFPWICEAVASSSGW